MGTTEGSAVWRANRAPGWTKDIGYALQSIVQFHRYEQRLPGKRPEDPGWHPCSCGWEGYWVQFEPHVADELRAVVAERFQL